MAGWVGKVEREDLQKKKKGEKKARLNGEPFREVRFSTGAAQII